MVWSHWQWLVFHSYLPQRAGPPPGQSACVCGVSRASSLYSWCKKDVRSNGTSEKQMVLILTCWTFLGDVQLCDSSFKSRNRLLSFMSTGRIVWSHESSASIGGLCGSRLQFMFTPFFLFVCFFFLVGVILTHNESVTPPTHRMDGWMDGCCRLLLRQYWHQNSVHCLVFCCDCQMICGVQVSLPFCNVVKKTTIFFTFLCVNLSTVYVSCY